jgi:hypothetical protein
MPRKREAKMKRISIVLGLALLMGCANSDNGGCPRKDKGCGKNVTTVENTAVVQSEAAQTVEESVTPSK